MGSTTRRLGAAVGVALVLAAPAAAAADPPRVFVGRAVGAVRLGMTEAAVRAAYGAPKRTTEWRLGGRSGPTAVYAVPRGKLLVHLEAGRVVAVETTSSRYRLADGTGVGTLTPRRQSEFSFSWRGFRFDACTGAYRRRAYRATTELVLPFAATTGRTIIAIAIADDAHALLLPGAARCD
jgi:hypothetical protein